MTPQLIYLASPYSHPDENVREDRFAQAVHASAELMRHGAMVFSPVAYGHLMAKAGVPEDAMTALAGLVLEKCDILAVLMCRGWADSKDVMADMATAKACGKPVVMLTVAGEDAE